MKPMRIAVYYNLPFGGAKRAVQEHVKGLKKRGHVVDVYTLDKQHDMFDPGKYADNEYRYVFQPKTVTMPVLNRIVSDFHTFVTLKEFHKKIAREIDGKAYDVVLLHHDTATNNPYLLRFLKTRNVYYCMEPLRMVYEYGLHIPDNLNWFNKLYESLNRVIRKKIDRTNALAAKKILTLSLFGREYMIHAYNLYPEIVPLGVDEKLFKPLKIKKKNQILFVAEPEYIYGHDLLQEAIALIPKEKRPDVKFVFGTKKSRRITDADLVKAYNESLMTLSLSRYDTFGLVPLESMSCGTPVIALNVAGYRETMQDNKTGYVVEFNAKEIADKIMYLISHPDEAVQMGQYGRKWVEEQWTWDIQIDKIEKLLAY